MKRNLFKVFVVLMVFAMLVSPASAQQAPPEKKVLNSPVRREHIKKFRMLLRKNSKME